MAPKRTMRPEVEAAYGGRLRVRVGALLFDDEAAPSSVLLVRHAGMHGDDPFWTPPGGGVDFGEALGEAVSREAREEVGLDVEVGALRYVLDFVRPPLHAVSFYFAARATGGTLRAGTDPELSEQLIEQVAYVPFEALGGLRLFPEGLADRLAADAHAGFPEGAMYLGTKR